MAWWPSVSGIKWPYGTTSKYRTLEPYGKAERGIVLANLPSFPWSHVHFKRASIKHASSDVKLPVTMQHWFLCSHTLCACVCVCGSSRKRFRDDEVLQRSYLAFLQHWFCGFRFQRLKKKFLIWIFVASVYLSLVEVDLTGDQSLVSLYHFQVIFVLSS